MNPAGLGKQNQDLHGPWVCDWRRIVWQNCKQIDGLFHLLSCYFSILHNWTELWFACITHRHPMGNFQKLKAGNSSNSWLMLWAIATTKVFSIGISRLLISCFLWEIFWKASPQEFRCSYMNSVFWLTARECSCWFKRKHKDLWFWPQCLTTAF